MADTSEGFTIIPNWLIRDSDLSAQAVLVYMALRGRADADGRCWPSVPTLAKESRTSDSTVRRVRKELRARGLITWESRSKTGGAQTSNMYTVNLKATGTLPVPPLTPPAPPFHPDREGVSGRQGEGVTQTPKEEPCEEDPLEELLLKSALTSRRDSFKHSNEKASEAQVTFLKDCYILLHQELPDATDIDYMRRRTSAEAHAEIRMYWKEIAQGSGHLLHDAQTLHWQHLSPRARRFIATQIGEAA